MNKTFTKYLLISLSSLSLSYNALAQDNQKNNVGIIKTATEKTPIPGVSVFVSGEAKLTLSSDQFGKIDLSKLPAGTYTFTFSHVGFKSIKKTIQLPLEKPINILMLPNAFEINEVFVTAKESKNLSTSSIIDKKAMEHLQPSSFTDILELLPGGRAKDPSLMGMNNIQLREVGIENNAYATSSLGTAFYIDGNVMNTNANMQTTGGYTSSSPNDSRDNTSRGVDMRSINVDDIEKIEIIRGIPSVEYGDLTSGMVIIDRKKGATPWTARMKADGFSKLFSVGKGIENKKEKLKVNFDMGYLNSKSSPINIFENYKRINASVRTEKIWATDNTTYNWFNAVDFNTTIDGERVDPDNDYLLSDSYKSSVSSYGLTNNLDIYFKKKNWFKSIEIKTKVNYQKNTIDQSKFIQASSATVLANSLISGSHESQYLTPSYTSQLDIYGQPFTSQVKVMTKLVFNKSPFKQHILLGAESNFSKNFGKGPQYDINFPTNIVDYDARPRAFSSIPGMHTLSLFAEDKINTSLGNHKFEAMIGARAFAITSLDAKYDLANKVQIDPRANVRWSLPRYTLSGKNLDISFAGGIGIQSKSPTLEYLNPNLNYREVVELAYFHNNPAYRLAYSNTTITDPTNFNIQNARNKKFEFGTDINLNGNRLSVTYFNEKMNDGFREMSQYNAITYNKYNNNSVNPNTITEKPNIEDFTYTENKEFYAYQRVENGSSIHKQGIEYQFSSNRISAINTRVTVNGAWFKTIYNNSTDFLKVIPTSSVTDGGKVRQYVGLYNDPDGYYREQLNTNITLDSYLPKLGLTLSTSFQNIWYLSRQTLEKTGMPVGYYDIDWNYKTYTEADKTDPNLQELNYTYVPGAFIKTTVPIDLQVNFKVTKNIKNKITAAMFVNRLFTYTPNYTVNNIRVTRQGFSSPYFGMELNFKL